MTEWTKTPNSEQSESTWKQTAQETLKKLQEKDKTIENLTGKNLKLQQQLTQAEELLLKLEDRQKLQTELDETQKSLRIKSSECSQLKESNADLQKKLTAAQTKAETADQACKNAQKDAEAAAAKKWQDDNDDLTRREQQLKADRAALEADTDETAQRKTKQLEKELRDKMARDISDAKRDKEAAKEELEQAKAIRARRQKEWLPIPGVVLFGAALAIFFIGCHWIAPAWQLHSAEDLTKIEVRTYTEKTFWGFGKEKTVSVKSGFVEGMIHAICNEKAMTEDTWNSLCQQIESLNPYAQPKQTTQEQQPKAQPQQQKRAQKQQPKAQQPKQAAKKAAAKPAEMTEEQKKDLQEAITYSQQQPPQQQVDEEQLKRDREVIQAAKKEWERRQLLKQQQEQQESTSPHPTSVEDIANQ